MRDRLLPTEQAIVDLIENMHIDKITMMTVSEMLRNVINELIAELPQLIIKPSFYKNIFSTIDNDDKKLKTSV